MAALMGQVLAGHVWVVRALGWTLLHFCWQGLAVAGTLWCLLGLFSGRAAKMRYAASCCALLLMVVAPAVTFCLLAAEARRAGLQGPVPSIDWVITVMPGGAGSGHWMEGFARALDVAAPWLPWLWMVGVTLFLARLQVGLVVARAMKTDGTEQVSDDLARRFDELKRRVGVRRMVRLVHSARVQAPAVIGWLRPVVLMPIGCLASLSTAQVEALLAHELAHIRRHDYLVSVAQAVVEALLFYHPAVWWVSKQVRMERECRCDEVALEAGGNALEYAKALSFLETSRAVQPELALGANGGVLTMRIKRMLGYRESTVASQGAAFALLAVALVLPGGYMATMARAQHALSSPSKLSIVKHEATVQQGNDVPPSADGRAKVPAGVMAGNLLSKVNPVYPPAAKQEHVQGAVVLKAILSKEGTMQNLQVESGPEMLRASALDAVRQWTYKPYLLNGQPTEVETTITVNYALSGSSSAPKHIGNGVTAPVPVSMRDPEYTDAARKAKIGGNVLISLVVNQQGNPTHVKVVRGLGNGLDEKAVEAVQRYKFKPGMENGKPVDVALNIEVNFQIF